MSPSGFSSPFVDVHLNQSEPADGHFMHYRRTTLDYPYRPPNRIIVGNPMHERGRDLHPLVPLAVSALRDV